ncbi:MAG TPA: SRPBCC family protein [Solirubrobacteraceae bacterium]|nr:SRPBCC family protein [Solirubrobacteraceae bacterium]
MPTARRSRTVAAAPEEVWATVADPHHLPRWWPRVQRVEGVTGDRFTQVLTTDKGRAVRADFRLLEARAPELCRWVQEVEGTPFANLLAHAETEVRVARAADGARVELVARQRLRGSARLGGFLVRRATARVLDEALEALASLHAPAR